MNSEPSTKLPTRYEKLERQSYLLIFSLYLLCSGIVLSFSPGHFVSLTSFRDYFKRISLHGGHLPYQSGFIFIGSSFNYMLIWFLKYDTMYWSMIFVRLLWNVPMYFALTLMEFSSWTLCFTFGLFEFLWVLVSYFWVEYRKQVRAPSVMKTNVALPPTWFVYITVAVLFTEGILSIFAPSFLQNTILRQRNPLTPFWIRWIGVELCGQCFLYIQALRKNCSPLIYFQALFNRSVLLIGMSFLLIFHLLNPSFPMFIYLIIHWMLILISAFSIREERIDTVQ